VVFASKRDRVYRRDGLFCRYCDRSLRDGRRGRVSRVALPPATIDHVVPVSRGGGWELENLVTACFDCNNEKGDKTLGELGWTLLPIHVNQIFNENQNESESNMTNQISVKGLFSGLRNAQVGGAKKPYMHPGVYVVKVQKAVYKATRKKGDAFILEFEVVQSNYEAELATITRGLNGAPPNIAELDKTLPTKAGTNGSWYQSMADKDIGWGALKGFAAAIVGQENPNDPAFMEGVETMLENIIANNMLEGVLLPLECVMIKTQKDTDFTTYNWGKAIES
jgi:hypothetical protein